MRLDFDPARLNDVELLAMIRALDDVERDGHGQLLMEALVGEASTRQRSEAQAEGWHVSHEPPDPPDWSE